MYDILVQEPNFAEGYFFRNQLPVSLRQAAAPTSQETRLKSFGFFAQDQWTLQRLTLNLGVRLDIIEGHVPAQTRPASLYVPAIPFEAVDSIPLWKDINPRLGVAYDLFGDGRTAIKASVGRYNFNTNYSLRLTKGISPAQAIVVGTNRTWNDANGNFVPDCDLQLRGANGECGAMQAQDFGTPRVTRTFSPDVLEGWGVNPHLSQASVTLQHELRPGIGLTVGYFRTWYGGQTLTDNLAVTAADFDPFCTTGPTDPRLPGGGGNEVCGFFDVSREKFGQFDNFVIRAEDVGGRTQVFNGIDVLLNARFAGGAVIQGGLSTGQTVIDNCNVADAQSDVSRGARSGPFCRTVRPWSKSSEIKFVGVYPLPWWGVQVSGTFLNVAGLPQDASAAAFNEDIAPSLGRNLSACPTPTGPCNARVTIRVVEPFTLWESRGNQVDTRVSKTFQMGRTRLQANFDVYNLFNSADVLRANDRFGPQWLRPVSILAGRLMKVSAQLDF